MLSLLYSLTNLNEGLTLFLWRSIASEAFMNSIQIVRCRPHCGKAILVKRLGAQAWGNLFNINYVVSGDVIESVGRGFLTLRHGHVLGRRSAACLLASRDPDSDVIGLNLDPHWLLRSIILLCLLKEHCEGCRQTHQSVSLQAFATRLRMRGACASRSTRTLPINPVSRVGLVSRLLKLFVQWFHLACCASMENDVETF